MKLIRCDALYYTLAVLSRHLRQAHQLVSAQGKVPSYNETIQALLAAVFSFPAWINVTFTNSWVNFGAPAQTVQYRKIGDRVYLRGTAKSGTINTSAFTLPAGYRPPAALGFTAASNGAYGELTVNADGTVVPNVGNNTYFHFQCAFSVTA